MQLAFLLELNTSNAPLICEAFALPPKPACITAAFSAPNVPGCYFKRTWQSVPSQGEQSSAKTHFSLPRCALNPAPRSPPQRSGTVPLSSHSCPRGGRPQASGGFPFVSVGLRLASSPNTAAPFPKMFVPDSVLTSACSWPRRTPARQESCVTFSARGATPRAASSAGRRWKIQVAWFAAQGRGGPVCLWSPTALKGTVLATFGSNKVWPQQPSHPAWTVNPLLYQCII